MNKRAAVIFRVLLNRYHRKSDRSYLSALPVEEAKAISAQVVSSTDLLPILGQPSSVMAKIHYSWLQPLVAHFPDSLKMQVIASLTEEQMAGFRTTSLPKVSSFVKIFFLTRLYHLLQMDQHLPVEYLPQTDLSPLASLKKLDLMGLIDFLGLHDLAAEVRKIVDRNQLRNVFACLNPKQTHYLKMCLNQKAQLTVQKMGLDLSKQNCSLLMQTVHKRGIIRLSRSLCGEHDDLVWHIAHILDSGRGSILLKEHEACERSKVTEVLKQQVINTLSFLTTHVAQKE